MTKRLTSLTHFGKLLNGQIVLDNGRWFKGTLAGFEDCDVKLTVERKRGTRSEKMNNYLWGVVYETIAEKTGYLPEEVHQIFRSKFLSEKRVWRGGNITIARSTATLTTDEFSEYLNQIISDVAEMSIEIPLPDKEYAVHRDFAGTM